MAVYRDRCRETSTTTGTGTITLSNTAPTGFSTFDTCGIVTGDYVIVAIVHQTLSEWEVVQGVYDSAAHTLTREHVDSSSNSNALVNFSAGTKDVFVTIAADDIIDQGRVTAMARGLAMP